MDLNELTESGKFSYLFDFELEVSWWDMQSNSSCNRVRSVVVHELVEVVNSLTRLSELNSVVLVVTEDTLVRYQVN